jgi:hypothetical protein
METLKINQEMDITSAVSALDAIFYGWPGGPADSDDLSSQKERQEIG